MQTTPPTAATLTAREQARWWLYCLLFTLSGAAGLVYESIWSHYLKLLLGHAAYAQTVVLAMFMGGMACGAWYASRLAARLARPLLGYALVELAIGVCALAFHRVFVVSQDAWLDFAEHASVAPTLLAWLKWGLAALLIAPQSALLGATFPLMTTGLLRRFPARPGHTLATLYGVNSLGGVAGVLASGLWLIAALGLPGTIALAGLGNLLLAGSVWLLEPGTRDGVAPTTARSVAARRPSPQQQVLFVVAAATGFASFVYEMAWIRMLSMVLGAATHSFELMLAAFILGLAAGGGWIRRRLDTLGDGVLWLAGLQLAMGLCALAALALYPHLFDAMALLLQGLTRTPTGYGLYLGGGYLLASCLMLPATFCAGTTLPLITHTLLRGGRDARAIGQVYALNTLGGIAGVMATTHVLLPLFGLRDALMFGASVDMLAAVLLCWPAAQRGAVALRFAAIAAGALLLAHFFTAIDPRNTAAGVYRYGRARLPSTDRVLRHADGKTASIDLLRHVDGAVSILTNGKADAAIAMNEKSPPLPDEPTMVLLGALPLALHGHAQRVATIGLGSGLTSATLLADRRIRAVDTIEIEAEVVRAARVGFVPRTARAFDDPRSRIVVDDAKSFFAAEHARYDVIVSEPSNPWVSGVAGLFSQEFYARARHHLAADGLLVQWLHMYEIEPDLVASVLNALGTVFADYVVYQASDSDIVIVAGNRNDLDTLDGGIFAEPALAAELARVNVRDLTALRAHRLGDRALFEPLFASYRAPANSDYAPYLDQHAARTRFMRSEANELMLLTSAPLPLLEMLDPRRGPPPVDSAAIPLNHQVTQRREARALAQVLLGDAPAAANPPPVLRAEQALLVAPAAHCDDASLADAWRQARLHAAMQIVPLIDPAAAAALQSALDASPCGRTADAAERQWQALYAAAGARDAAGLAVQAEALLAAHAADDDDERYGYLVAGAMLGEIARGSPRAALGVWRSYGASHWHADSVNVYLRMLLSTAAFRAAGSRG